MACACGKCDTFEIEKYIRISYDGAVKSTNALWRSRIQKRIDYFAKEQIKTNNSGNKRLIASVIKAELEGLLK